MASDDSGRRTHAARGDDMREELSTKAPARVCVRALVALVCALMLLAPPAPILRAQSGRKGDPPAPPKGKEGTRSGNQTPTPTPILGRPTGPIAEPPTPAERSSGRAKGEVVTPTQNQQPGVQEVGDDEVVSITSSLVPLPASVVDARGRAVSDLRVEDFELRVDGEVKPIGELTHTETPVSIALLFDNSSSQNATREFERQAGVRFLKSVVRSVDRAAVYSISTAPELAHPFTSDVRALVRTIENFGKAEGATAFFDTVAVAADYLKPERARKVIVIISDGTDTVSDLDFDTTMARVIANDCQVYAIQTGNSDSPNLHDLAGARRMQEFAAQTGGAVYVPRNNAELSDAFKQIAADLAQQYVISYYPAGQPRDGRFRSFTLNVKTRPNLRVRTRKGYYAPKG
ncbi:MAG: VWA domain-containing protein [Rubrivivax sp.]|nr:VWA domain-containing protein [Pyrinomonadaceae bacterium]